MSIFKKSKLKDIIYLSVILVLLVSTVILSVIVVLDKKEEESLEHYYNMKCYSFGVQNANLSDGQIIFVGDSITDLYPLDSYYSDLDLATYNRGIGGDTTKGVLERMDVSIFDRSPKKIVLMIGTNDVNGKNEDSYILDNYRQIIDEIREKLPEGFQRAEYLREHGMVDIVVHRSEMKNKLAMVLSLLMSNKENNSESKATKTKKQA